MGKEGARVGGGVVTHKAEDLAEKVHQGSRNDEGPGELTLSWRGVLRVWVCTEGRRSMFLNCPTQEKS